MTTNLFCFVELAFIIPKFSLSFILRLFWFIIHVWVKVNEAQLFMVFVLNDDQFYPSHWIFHFFLIISTVMSFEFLHSKVNSSRLLLQFYLILRSSFTQWYKQLSFSIMAFPLAREDSLTIWFQYHLVITSLSAFFFTRSDIFRHVFLTLMVTCSFTFITFSFWFFLFLFLFLFIYDVLFPKFYIKNTLYLYLFNQ